MKNFVFLHVSTDEVYGSLEIGERPFKETNQIQPNSPYSASKASSDMLVRAWHHTYKLPTLTTNCSNNYGPFQYPEKLIPLTIDNAINLKPIKLYGDGSNIRDWLFVNDHCSGIKSVINNGKFGEIYNIGGLNEFSNLDIVKTICKLLDEKNHHLLVKKSIKSYSDLITFVEDRPGHDFRYSVDPSKLQKELGWSPEITFDEGISTTIDWYLDNQDWINALKRQN
jgi:dTDP-glucose 4,6-dehydratase